MATKTISVEQRFELLAKLGANIDWDALNSGGIQQIIDKPGDAGKQLTLFLKNGCRLNLGEMKIIPAPCDPVKFIGKDWKTVPAEHDSRNDEITEIDFPKVDFVHSLNQGEDVITGEEKLKRLKAGKQIRYGASVFMGLWLDYQARKENSVLETLFRAKGITYLDFFGDVLLGPRGSRGVLCLYRRDDGQWGWGCSWLDRDWGAERRSVVSSQEVSS